MLDPRTAHQQLEDVRSGLQLVARLPRFLKRPVKADEARQALARRLSERTESFLALVQRAVYQQPSSPTLRLLRHAGCEPGDLAALVHERGLEGALANLFQRGVYLTVDELKARRPIVRGSLHLAIEPGAFRNPLGRAELYGRSSGSRGSGSIVPISLEAIRSVSLSRYLALEARGGLGWQHAIWSVPGGAAITQILRYCAMGIIPVRWFSQVDPGTTGLHARYVWSARALHWGGRLAGRRLPSPEFVPHDQAVQIARWMQAVLQRGQTPQLHTFSSSAVLLCRAAEAAGLEIAGAQVTVIGEPFTPARQAVLERAGLGYVTNYATTECPSVAAGCLAPAPGDAAHLLHEIYALVQPGPDGLSAGLPPDTLLYTTLRPSATLLLLNASMGDRAELTEGGCACAMTRLGWPTRLRNISSFEKLTLGGMMLLDAQVAEVLEALLPSRFGGGPTDYQLVEEASQPEPRLRLLVHPSVGPLDPATLTEAFYTAIGAGSGSERVAVEQWRQLQVLRVERRSPLTTSSGKILHVHQDARVQATAGP